MREELFVLESYRSINGGRQSEKLFFVVERPSFPIAFVNRGKSLRHVAMVAKFLNENKPKMSQK